VARGVRPEFAMAEVSISHPIHDHMMERPEDLVGSDPFNTSIATSTAPIPNPPFTFPMLPPQSPDHGQSGAGSTSGRRFSNRSRPNNISVSPLPVFDFPPSSSDSVVTPNDTLAHSPSRSINIPPRSGGHRRGGSEFIGGNGNPSGPGLMSTSPTKADGTLPTPPVSGRGPPGGRRGHAHRRSAAISHHDLSAIIKPSNEIKPGSAPTTPSDPNGHQKFLPSLDRSASQPVLSPSVPSPSASSPSTPSAIRRETAPANGQPRPRVGFSDTLEFIPRPLSTISSETSSSLSTIRASHSLTGSISSVLSTNTSTPPSTKKSEPIFETPLENDNADKRPSSAGALLDKYPLDNSFHGNSIISQRPASAAGSPGATSFGFRNSSPTRRTLFPRGPLEDELSPKTLTTPPTHTAVPKTSSQSLQDFQLPPGEKCQLRPVTSNRPRSSPETGIAKRQKKARSWGSILSRKSKQRVAEDQPISKRSLTPPLRDFAPLDNFPLEEVNFDDDNTCVIRTPQYDVPKPPETLIPQWTSPGFSSSRDAQTSSPILDLDAALAAFDHDQSGSGGFLSGKRRMHSSGATGAFTGPGMHYHRRAESAPVMAPVDFKGFGIHRLGSNPAMADVFEEDEEDENHSPDTTRKIRAGSKTWDNADLKGLGVQIMDVGDNEQGSARPRVKQTLSENNDTIRKADSSPDPLPTESIVHEDPPVHIAGAVEEPRFSTITKTSDDSTITPTLSLHQPDSQSLNGSMDFALPRASMYHDQTETTSSVSSPDFMNGSFDVPRLHTANSSITDRTTWSSSRPGEPAQWLSTEDVPSLTSSASTMISGPQPRFSSSGGTRPLGERSASFSAAVPRRTRPVSAGKRSSLASLSRLVGSSYGEKSKLSIESRAHEESDKSDKKKGNRISRLMKFWKSKEKLVP
jgi:hypothetical protein